MAYESTLAPAAKKTFDSLPAATQVHVATAVAALSGDPRPPQSKKAGKQPGPGERRRLPVDDVVLVYDVDDGKRTVVVAKIAAT